MKNLTPPRFRCQLGMCPAVYELEDGKLAIIGKHLPSSLKGEFDGLVGEDEHVIIIERGMLENVTQEGLTQDSRD